MTEIRENFSLFSAKQLGEIRFQLEDIIYSFPYRIGVIMNDSKYYLHTLSKFESLMNI